MNAKTLAIPAFSLRPFHVWRRNSLVWRKLAIPSMLGNLADPMLYMLGLGYGLGALMAEVDGRPYIAFLAAVTVSRHAHEGQGKHAEHVGLDGTHE